MTRPKLKVGTLWKSKRKAVFHYKNKTGLCSWKIHKSLSEKVLELERLQQDIKAQQQRLVFESDSFKQEKKLNFELDKKTFNYICLTKKEKKLFQICGLTVNEFDCLLNLLVCNLFYTS